MLRLASCPSGWSVGCYAMRSDTKPATCAAMLRGRLKLVKFQFTLRQLHEMGVCRCRAHVWLSCLHCVDLCGVALGVRSMKALAIQGLVNPGVYVRVVTCICAKPQVCCMCCAGASHSHSTYNISSSRSSNLVDSASSHTLVSKIKPCMSKYKYFYFETANGSLYQL